MVHHAIFGNKGLGDQQFYGENISINDTITKKLQWGEVSTARIHHKLLERYEQQRLNLWKLVPKLGYSSHGQMTKVIMGSWQISSSILILMTWLTYMTQVKRHMSCWCVYMTYYVVDIHVTYNIQHTYNISHILCWCLYMTYLYVT